MLREHIFYSRFYVVCGELCREPEVKLNLQLPRDDIGDTGASMNINVIRVQVSFVKFKILIVRNLC